MRPCAASTTATMSTGRLPAGSPSSPGLTRLETMPAETVWAAANEVPPEWYGGDLAEMEALVEKLLARRSRIRELDRSIWALRPQALSQLGQSGNETSGETGSQTAGDYDRRQDDVMDAWRR